MTETPSRNAWYWVPSLYFSQGIPYVMVMTMSVVMYKRLGLSNTDIAFYTSWLNLPWVIKPLWSPLVDITRTKRFWVVAMQFLVSLALALVAISVCGGAFLRASLFLFWIMAFASATHDIAADGFYMLSLSKHEQAWWVGLRSTFYRAAMIVGSGLLVVLAGGLESRNGLPPLAISVSAKPVSSAPSLAPAAIQFTATPGPLHIVAQPSLLGIGIVTPRGSGTNTLLPEAKVWNLQHGFTVEEQNLSTRVEKANSWWTRGVSRAIAEFFDGPFPKSTGSREPRPRLAICGVIYLALSGPPPAGQTLAVDWRASPAGWNTSVWRKSDPGFPPGDGRAALLSMPPTGTKAPRGGHPARPEITAGNGGNLPSLFRQHPPGVEPHPVCCGRTVSGVQLLAQRHAAAAAERWPGGYAQKSRRGISWPRSVRFFKSPASDWRWRSSCYTDSMKRN